MLAALLPTTSSYALGWVLSSLVPRLSSKVMMMKYKRMSRIHQQMVFDVNPYADCELVTFSYSVFSIHVTNSYKSWPVEVRRKAKLCSDGT